MNDIDAYDPVANLDSDGDGMVVVSAKEGLSTATYYIASYQSYSTMLTRSSSGTISQAQYAGTQYQRWVFTPTSDGYYAISPAAATSYCLTVNTSTKAVTVAAKSTSYTNQKWNIVYSNKGVYLTCYSTTSSINGLKLKLSGSSMTVASSGTALGLLDYTWYTPTTALTLSVEYVAPEQTKTPSFTPIPSNATYHPRWMSYSTTSAGRVSFSGGQITGSVPGSGYISFTDSITRVSGSQNWEVTEIANGTHTLALGGIEYYATAVGGTMSNGTQIQTNIYAGDTHQRWVFTLQSDGYYTISSAKNSNYYLSFVSTSTSSTANARLYYASSASSTSSSMRFKITKVASGSYRLTPKHSEAAEMALAVSTISSNGVVSQIVYTEDSSYNDEWNILPIDSYKVNFVGIPDSNSSVVHDHASASQKSVQMLAAIGHNNSSLLLDTTNASTIISLLKSSNMFIYRGHGTTASSGTIAGLCLYDVSSSTSGNTLYSHPVSNLPSGSGYISSTNNFSGLDLAIFLSCMSGVGGTNGLNFPYRLAECGAYSAIGFDANILCDPSEKWLRLFFSRLTNTSVSYTVQEAMDYATANTDYFSSDIIVSYGDLNYNPL